MKLGLSLFFFIFFTKFSFAGEKIIDPNSIHKNLRCLVCQGQLSQIQIQILLKQLACCTRFN